MTDALAQRLLQQHAAYITKRNDAVTVLADELWKQATAEPMVGWTVTEITPPSKAFYSRQSPPKLETTLRLNVNITEKVHQMIATLRGPTKGEDYNYEEEILRALDKNLSLKLGNDVRFDVNCRRIDAYRTTDEKAKLVATIGYKFV